MDYTLKLSELKKPKFIGTLIMWAIAILIAVVKPFEGLSAMGHGVLASILAALAVWIFKPGKVPNVTGLIILFIGCVKAGLPLSTVAGGFSGSTIWLLIPALFFGFALKKTGLAKRIAFSLLRIIKPTYLNIVLCWFLLGLAFSLLTPSIGIRFLILTAIAISVADACELPHHSKGRSLIVITAWSAGIFPGTGWLTGSLYGPVCVGFLPESMKSLVGESEWLKAMIGPWLFITIGMMVGCYLLLKPKEPLKVTKGTMTKMYKDLGIMTSAEKILLVTLMLVLICMPIQKKIGLSSYQLMLIGFFVLLLTRVIEKKDINTGISWDVILFIGSIVTMSNLINSSGIGEWIAPFIGSIVPTLAANNLVFVLGFFLLFLLLRFVDVTWGWAVCAFLATATPLLHSEYGIHPVIMLFIFTIGGSVFLTSYQQPWIPQTEAIMQDAGWDDKDIRKAAILYVVLAAVALIAFIPLWKGMGFLR